MKFFLVIISFAFINFSTYAFTLNNNLAAAFVQNEVRVNVASGLCENLGITDDELLGIATEAVANYWNRVPSSRLRLITGEFISVAANFRTDPLCSGGGRSPCDPNPNLALDKNITIACNVSPDNFGSSSVLALTLPNNIAGTSIKSAIVLINDQPSNVFQNKARDEMSAIIAHEIGHAIGLGHSPVQDSLMYFQSVPTRRSLGWDDIDGVTFLYPDREPFGCGSIEIVQNRRPSILITFLFAFLIAAGLFQKQRTERSS